MAYDVIVMLLVISLLLLFVVYFKYVKMKQHFCLLEIACVYALYTINNKDKRLDVALIMTILHLFEISLENNYLEEIYIYLNRLDADISHLRTIENLNDTVFSHTNKR